MPSTLRRLALIAALALTACRSEPKLQKVELQVEGMTCESCVQAIEHSVGKLEGVASCEVDLAGERATVVFREGEAQPEQFVAAIEKLGYEAAAGAVEPVAEE